MIICSIVPICFNFLLQSGYGFDVRGKVVEFRGIVMNIVEPQERCVPDMDVLVFYRVFAPEKPDEFPFVVHDTKGIERVVGLPTVML